MISFSQMTDAQKEVVRKAMQELKDATNQMLHFSSKVDDLSEKISRIMDIDLDFIEEEVIAWSDQVDLFDVAHFMDGS